jgi:hypothetical protein
MGPFRQAHEEGHVANDVEATAALIEGLGKKPTPRKERGEPAEKKAKAKEADTFSTCKACTSKYTDAPCGSGGNGKNNYRFFSRTCRGVNLPRPRTASTGAGRSGSGADASKDCGTGRCEHGREKGKCRGCGTGCCEHGRQKAQCKDCGTGQCKEC